jgi:non-ribosomal peptide synthetase component F
MSQLVHNDVSSTLVPLQHAPMMDQEEQQLVLKGFNQTTRPYDATSFVHGMFAEHVRRQPASPCVIFEDHVYSYVEVGLRCVGGNLAAAVSVHMHLLQHSVKHAAQQQLIGGCTLSAGLLNAGDVKCS